MSTNFKEMEVHVFLLLFANFGKFDSYDHYNSFDSL